jgi:hypothetical protein
VLALRRRARAARFAVSLGLAATANVSLAGTIAAVMVVSEGTAFAQKPSPSAQKLIDNAKKSFDDAQYDESIQLLSAALLKFDISDPQKVEVYKWLAYNYIVLKKDEAAKSAVYKLYAVDENYELPKSESPRFREPFTKWKQSWIDDGKPGQVAPTEKPPAPVLIKHLPASEVPHDQSVSISGTVEDPDKRVAKVILFYRTGSTGNWSQVPATYGLGSFKANIPGTAVTGSIVEYYVQAVDKDGLAVGTRGDADTPLRIVVKAEAESSIFESFWFWTGATAVVAATVVTIFIVTKKKDNGPGPVGPNPGGNSSVTIIIGE